jgi:predicted Zn-dependent peptidase
VTAIAVTGGTAVRVAGDRLNGREPRFDSIAGVDDRVRRTTTASGIRVISDSIPEAHSVSVSAWVGAGSRDEPSELAGACHFLEHLLFKGTHRRTAHEINSAIDKVGGEFNAYTSKESTTFLVRVPAVDLELGASLLCEVVSDPLLSSTDVEAERGVILEELAMVADSPDELALSIVGESLYPGHGLGWEVLGREDTLGAMDRDQIASIHDRWYGGANVVVAAAGRVDHDELVALVEAGLPAHSTVVPERVAPSGNPTELRVEHRDTEQVHLVQGWVGVDHDDPDRFALAVLNHAVGDGPSSRLYRSIRDERGLAYSVFTSHTAYSDSGMVTLYVGTTPSHLGEVRSLVNDQLEHVQGHGITDEELEVAVGYLTGSMVLALEDPGTRMARLGAGELTKRGVVPITETLDGFASVGQDDVVRVARRVFGGASSTVAVGPLRARQLRG